MLLVIIGSCEEAIIIDVMKLNDVPGINLSFYAGRNGDPFAAPTLADEVNFADVLCQLEMMGNPPSGLPLYCA